MALTLHRILTTTPLRSVIGHVTAGRASSTEAVSNIIPASYTHVIRGDVRKGLLEGIGNTSLISLPSLSSESQGSSLFPKLPAGSRILGKAEWTNPGGSVKDRAALGLILAAEKGLGTGGRVLKPGKGIVVEGTAGNTGIGLAHVCNARGYKLIIYMPNTQSTEKIDLLRLLGADVRPVPAVALTDPKHYTFQARDCAASLGENAIWTNQFDNTCNRMAHYASTGPEIWTQTAGKIDAFVASTGTGGTLAGIGMYLKEASKGAVKIVLADPPGSVLHSWVQSGGKKMERSGGSFTEGIGQGRVTANLAGAPIDDSVFVDDNRTLAMLFRLLKDEGIFVGASSALNVVAAMDVASKLGPNSTVVTMLCDGAYRYQTRLFSKTWLESKGLYAAVPEDCKHLVSLA
jgi:cysteine synthase A